MFIAFIQCWDNVEDTTPWPRFYYVYQDATRFHYVAGMKTHADCVCCVRVKETTLPADHILISLCCVNYVVFCITSPLHHAAKPLMTLKKLWEPWRPKLLFLIWNHHNCLSWFFSIHLNTYVMEKYFNSFSAGIVFIGLNDAKKIMRTLETKIVVFNLKSS